MIIFLEGHGPIHLKRLEDFGEHVLAILAVKTSAFGGAEQVVLETLAVLLLAFRVLAVTAFRADLQFADALPGDPFDFLLGLAKRRG